MNRAADNAKYKRLRVAVQSYTQGFTSIMWPAFGDLASQVQRGAGTSFLLDFLRRTVTPLPAGWVMGDFFEYRDLPNWFKAVGCPLRHVLRFQMRADFDPTTIQHFTSPGSTESFMRFHARTELDSDRGDTYSYNFDSGVWFDYIHERELPVPNYSHLHWGPRPSD